MKKSKLTNVILLENVVLFHNVENIREHLIALHSTHRPRLDRQSEDLQTIKRMSDEEIIDRMEYIKAIIEDRMNDAYNDALREFFIRNEP